MRNRFRQPLWRGAAVVEISLSALTLISGENEDGAVGGNDGMMGFCESCENGSRKHVSGTEILSTVQEVPVTWRCYPLHLAQNKVRHGSCSKYDD